ncbi:unnamed protein product [Protopolystoma xenopodis]|uniref:Uncharacterized protein n=1 Tax=Protopolystoma xenopodis TaxID=117903 RepID=A0A3S5AAV1_9PLAT|nr:unnamed protein product [Protopolystoma xenopodis]
MKFYISPPLASDRRFKKKLIHPSKTSSLDTEYRTKDLRKLASTSLNSYLQRGESTGPPSRLSNGALETMTTLHETIKKLGAAEQEATEQGTEKPSEVLEPLTSLKYAALVNFPHIPSSNNVNSTNQATVSAISDIPSSVSATKTQEKRTACPQDRAEVLTKLERTRVINFEKHRKEFAVLAKVCLLQTAARLYQLKPDWTIQAWLQLAPEVLLEADA